MPKPLRFNDTFDQPGPQCPETSPSPVDLLEPLPVETQAALFSQMAELLAPVLQFMAKGSKTGTLDMRAWIVLYVVRHDSIGGESVRQYAQRRGVAPSRIFDLVMELRKEIPRFRSSTEKPMPPR